jgi:hypothetical protein
MSKRPTWFIILAIILLLWALAGVGALAGHIFSGEAMAQQQGEWDLAFFRALPGWFVWDYALATVPALAGAIALLLRSKLALPLYILSLIGVVTQFGYVFLATDLIAHKGAAATVPFPAFIAVMALVQIGVANLAAKRGWVS